jgi:signal transduction histidine kinase
MRVRPDPNITRKTTRLYLLALTAVALLSVIGQVLVQQSLKRQASDSRVINIAGRQRMLSQRICKTVLLLRSPENFAEKEIYLSDLQEALELWQKCHTGLKNGYLAYINTPVNNSDSVRAMFVEIDPVFKAIFTQATAVQNYYQTTAEPNPLAVAQQVNTILQHERSFLKGMDRLVFQYDAEAARRVSASQRIEFILLISTLFILLLEGLFIFRPAVNQIQHTIALLVSSEKQTQKINEELVQVNKSLQETREALLQANEQKHRQEINEQKMRSAYLIQGQEEERKRVAREIHDGLGQMLTALKYGIEKVSDSVNASSTAQNHLNELRGVVSQTIAEARTISYNLMPAVLSDFGISSALKLLTGQVASGAGIQILFNTNWNGSRLPKNLEIGLYRVAQEGLHNAVKYARAQEIKVELWQKRKYIHLTIADNGQGFKYTPTGLPAGEAGLAQGLSNMKERAFLINGEINIISSPGQGTRISVKVPVETLIEHA